MSSDSDIDSVEDDEEFYTSDALQMRIPPLNLACVLPGIYRSGYPNRRNFEYMKTIGLKSVLCLCVDDVLPANVEFYAANNIRFFHVGIVGNTEPFQSIPADRFAHALNITLNPDNHPILVHCSKGKHRTGCLMAVLRRMCGWSLSAALDEYARFAGSRRRFLDNQFIELFDISPFMLNA